MMTNVVILGASGQIARWVVQSLAGNTAIHQTLLLRDATKLTGKEPANASVILGDVRAC